MKLKFLLLLISILIANLPVYSIFKKEEAKFNPSPQEAKEKSMPKSKSKQRLECCEIRNGKSEYVEIINICRQKKSTIVNIKILIPENYCTATHSLSINDNKDKIYQAIAIHGIPECPQKENFETGDIFSLEFERLDENITSISLKENINKIPPGAQYGTAWKWNDLSVSHCKF